MTECDSFKPGDSVLVHTNCQSTKELRSSVGPALEYNRKDGGHGIVHRYIACGKNLFWIVTHQNGTKAAYYSDELSAC